MRSQKRLFCLAAWLGTTMLHTSSLAIAAQSSEPALSPTASASQRCQAMASSARAQVYAQFPDAPTSVNSARVIPAGGTHGAADDDLPEYCRVEGMIAPTVGFLLRMPTKTWNGKFMMGGCGGPCGNYLEDRIDAALARNYAVVNTDLGHKGVGWLFAYHNPQGQTDFAYRATHLTAVVAKELIADFFGQRAARNYFDGCSTGGRQALVEAQRFPDDFEGIIAGAPVYNETEDAPYFLEWNVLVNTGPDWRAILPRDLLPVVHQSVLKQCDALDGLKDGVLQNPLACNFEPQSLICKPGAAAGTCLSREQVSVVQKFHDGAVNSKGEKLYFGMPWGSEEEWSAFIGADGRQNWSNGTSMTAILGFDQPVGPRYSLKDFNYDTSQGRLDLTGFQYNPLNPDLSRFAKAGHKLILFHGWNDNQIPVGTSLAYYHKATLANGGETATRRFLRFFAPPGMQHCRGGAGGGEIDWISALENWVEKDRPPEQVIAYRPVKPYATSPRAIEDYGGFDYHKFNRHPMPAGSYDTARPVYLYPAIARYSGKGDPAVAQNWRAAAR